MRHFKIFRAQLTDLLPIVLVVLIYLLFGIIFSNSYFDINFSHLKFLDSTGDALSYMGVVAAVTIPVWLEIAKLCNEKTLLGVIAHEAIKTKTVLYIVLLCAFLIIISSRQSFLYFPVLLFTLISIYIIWVYYQLRYVTTRINRKIGKALSTVAKRTLGVASVGDSQVNKLNIGDRSLIFSGADVYRTVVKAKRSGIVIGARVFLVRLVSRVAMKLFNCNVSIYSHPISAKGCIVDGGTQLMTIVVADKNGKTAKFKKAVSRVLSTAIILGQSKDAALFDASMDELNKIATNIIMTTTRDEIGRFIIFYDSIERTYDKFVNGKFSGYVPVDVDLKMFSYVGYFNNYIQNMGGRISELLSNAMSTAIKTGNDVVFSALVSKVVNGYYMSVNDENYVALSRYDRACRECMRCLNDKGPTSDGVDDGGFICERFSDLIITPLRSMIKQKDKISVNIINNRASFMFEVALLCASLKNSRYMNIYRNVLQCIKQLCSDDRGSVSSHAKNLIVCLKSYVEARCRGDHCADNYVSMLNNYMCDFNFSDISSAYMNSYDSNLVSALFRNAGIHDIDQHCAHEMLLSSWLRMAQSRVSEVMTIVSEDELCDHADFFVGNAVEWKDSIVYRIIKNSFQTMPEELINKIKEIANKGMASRRKNIEVADIDVARLDKMRQSINDYVKSSEWVQVLSRSCDNDADKDIDCHIFLPIFVSKFNFINEEIGGRMCIGLNEGLGQEVVQSISRFILKYCVDKFGVICADNLCAEEALSNRIVVLNNNAELHTRMSYFFELSSQKRLRTNSSKVADGVYAIPADTIGAIKLNDTPVIVEAVDLHGRKEVRNQFIQSKCENGYSKEEAASAADMVVLLSVRCEFKYSPVKASKEKIIYVP